MSDVVLRSQVMWLIAQAIKNSSDDEPPRHVLSVLWGKVRDLTDPDDPLVRRTPDSAMAELQAAAEAVLDYAVLPEMMANPRHQRDAFGIRIEDLRRLRDALQQSKGIA